VNLLENRGRTFHTGVSECSLIVREVQKQPVIHTDMIEILELERLEHFPEEVRPGDRISDYFTADSSRMFRRLGGEIIQSPFDFAEPFRRQRGMRPYYKRRGTHEAAMMESEVVPEATRQSDYRCR